MRKSYTPSGTSNLGMSFIEAKEKGKAQRKQTDTASL